MSEALSIAVQTMLPTLVWGSPGGGKTHFMYALARAFFGNEDALETVIASIREPSDFSGLPILTREDEVNMAAPGWAKRLVDRGYGMLFFDEITTAPPANQAALLRVTLEGEVGDTPLPKDENGVPTVMTVAAANPPEEAAGGWELSPPLANRFIHLNWTVNPQRWVEGIVSGFPPPKVTVLPKNWRDGIPSARVQVASYIRARPEQLHVVPKEEAKAGKAWASPRTWDMTATLIAACESVGADTSTRNELVLGTVGEGQGGEFLSYIDNLDLPDPEVILANVKKFTLPTRGDQQFAVLTSVVSAVANQLDKKRWNAGWDILAEAAKQGASDIAAGAATQLASSRTADLPLPVDQLQPFIPVLREAGLLGSN